MSKAALRRGILLAAAGILLVAVAALRLARTLREEHPSHPPTAPSPMLRSEALPSRPAGLPSAVARPLAPVPGEHKTGGHIRLRRPDGTYEVVEETTELYSRLTTGAMLKTVARFEAVQKELRDRFTQTLKESGPAAAWQLLVPLLRTPQPVNDDRARVYEALRLAVEIQRSLGQGNGRSGPYEAIRGPASDALVGFLVSPDVHSSTREIALDHLSNRRLSVMAAGPGAVEIDGLPAYDPEAVWEAFVMPESAPTPVPKPGEDPNPAFWNPALLDACLRLVRDEAEPASVRGQALRALGTKKETLQGLDLLALAGASDVELGKAAVELLGARPDAVPRTAFFSLLRAHDDLAWKTVVFEKLSGEAFGAPEMTEILIRDLPSQPRSTDQYREATYSNTVLQATLEQYFVSKDRGLFDLLVKALPTWAGFEWPYEGSPVVTVAEHASQHQLKEFASPLRALLPQLTSPEERKYVQAALVTLEK
jgi:hypothetical protein